MYNINHVQPNFSLYKLFKYYAPQNYVLDMTYILEDKSILNIACVWYDRHLNHIHKITYSPKSLTCRIHSAVMRPARSALTELHP